MVICCKKGIILPSYIGIVIQHYEDPYEPISTMDVIRVLLPLLIFYYSLIICIICVYIIIYIYT